MTSLLPWARGSIGELTKNCLLEVQTSLGPRACSHRPHICNTEWFQLNTLRQNTASSLTSTPKSWVLGSLIAASATTQHSTSLCVQNSADWLLHPARWSCPLQTKSCNILANFENNIGDKALQHFLQGAHIGWLGYVVFHAADLCFACGIFFWKGFSKHAEAEAETQDHV